MRVKTRRILSIILSMTILLGILPTAAFAEYNLSNREVIVEGTTEDTMPTLSAVYMTKDEDSGQFSEGTISGNGLEDEIFYIGLKISNFDKYTHMTSGLKSMTVSLVYDSKYIGPYGWKNDAYVFPGSEGYDGTITDDTKTVTGNYLNLSKEVGSGKNKQTKYLYKLTSKVLDQVSNATILSDSNSDTLEALQITISADTQTFTDLSTYALNEEYIAIVRFERQVEEEEDENGEYPLIACPSGTKVIGHLQEGSTTMLYGDDYMLTMYDGTTDLEEYLKLDASKAELFPPSYTVTYNENGGSYKSNDDGTEFDHTEEVGATLTDSADNKSYGNPTLKNAAGKTISDYIIPPSGKMFKEWQTEDGDTFDETSLVKDNITVKAYYEDGYNVNFHLNAADATYEDGTNTLKAITLGQGKSPAANAIANEVGGDPERSGYTFKGWYTKTNGAFDEKYTDDGADGSKAITTITGQTDLYAMWDNGGTGTYKLNFNSNPPAGATATDADPKLVGYNSADDTLKTVIGGLPKEPTTDKTGYKFLGWYKNQAGDGDKLTDETKLLTYTGATTDNAETTVYAKWGYVDDPHATPEPSPAANTVTITFPQDSNNKYEGGTNTNGTINNRYIKYGETVPNLPTATEMKHDTKGFGGWFTAAEGGTEVKADTVIDNTFTGVTPTGGGTVALYAHWVDKVTITYDMNGLTPGDTPAPLTKVPGEKFTPPAATDITNFNTDYTLVEWNTEKDGSGTSYAAGTETTVPSADTKLYAIWNYDETKDDAVTITFDGNDTTEYPATLTPNNGGSDTNKYTIVRKKDTVINPDHFPTAKRKVGDEKYTFNHWDKTKTAPAGAQGTIIAEADAGTKTMSVYAIWTVTNEADKRTVTFKKDATDADPYATVTVAVGDSVGPQMPANPTKDGHTFNKWLEGTNEFKADTQVNGNIIVIAEWTQELELKYDKNGLPDAVTVPGSEKGAPGTSKTVGNITANGAQVQLVEWNTKQDGSGTGYQPGATVTFDNTDPKDITLYAIWNSTDPNAKTITFLANDSTSKPATLTPSDTGNVKQYTMKRATGQTITAAQMPTGTRTDYELDHWGKTATETVPQTSETITVGTEDITRYAIWKVKDGVTSYNVTFNLHDATPQTVIGPIQVAAGDSLGESMPADPTRTKYTFNKWTTGSGTSKADFSKTTPINGDTVVDANWTIKVDVKFTKTDYNYDGNPHTPITDGNYKVFPKGETSGELTGLTLNTDKYLKITGKDETQTPPTNITEELPAGVTVPVGGGEYTYGTLTLTGGDGFTEYEINTIPATFKIKAKDIVITISDNYQYIGSSDTIADITLAADDTNVNTAITGGDLKVTFTDKDGNETNTMPSALGKYTIKVESANDSYNITTVQDNYGATGDAIPLYLINLQREVKVDYIDGTNKNATDVYATVTLDRPTTLNSTSDAKTTLAGQTPALDVPQQGTDFDPPTGKRIKKFVTGTKETDGSITDPVDFDKNSVISFSENNEALTIYAIYENADWTLKFNDTKTNPAAETFDDYTVDAEKSVKDGLSKKGSTAVTNPDEKTLPAPTAAPENMMFKGWTTDQSITTDANAKSTDFETGGKYDGKLFKDDTVPTATELGSNNELTVYAVYVKSSDATLKSALFKEILVTKDDDGNVTNEEVKADLKYVDALINPTDDTITFDPETDTYNIIVKNDFEKLLADLEPTQPGSTIAVKVNNTPVTNETTGVPAGHTQAKPGVDATVYDKDADTNSSNTIVVTVTAPDGSTKDYTFNVLRYAKPTVELMPGNSPYGMIERMGKKYKGDAGWTDEQIAAVKADLMDRNAKKDRYKFKDKITVDGVEINSLPAHASKDVIYQPIAWSDGVKDTVFHSNNLALDDNWFDKNINMDMNEEALFIYQKRAFTDPGIRVAYDELARPIDLDDQNITVKLTAKNIVRIKTTIMTEVESTQDYELTVETDPITKDRIISNLTAAGTKVIRPDIYELEYVIQRPGEEDIITTRRLVVISKRGDYDANNTVNSSDTTIMREWYQKLNTNTLYAGLPSTVSNLHFYRILDMDLNTAVNSSDETLGREIYQKLSSDMPDIYLDVKDLK